MAQTEAHTEARTKRPEVTRDLRLDDLFAIEIPEQPALSPDASTIVYVLTTVDRAADINSHALWCASPEGASPRPLTGGPDDTAPVWSPDGTRIAFLRTDSGWPQLHLLTVATGEVIQLTDLPYGAGRASFDPAGRRLAFTAEVDITGEGEPGPGSPPRPLATERLDYQADGKPWRRGVRHHVHVLAVPDRDVPAGTSTRAPSQLTDGDFDASAPAWSPGGDLLAFTAAMDPDADIVRTREVYLVPVVGGDRPRQVGPTGGHLGSVQWADGHTLLAGGRTDTRSGHDCLYRIDVVTGSTSNLTEALDRDLMRGATGYPGGAPQVIDGGRTILFCARDQGCTHLYAIPAAGGTARLVIGGDSRVVMGVSVARERIAVVLTTASSFGELVITDLSGRGEQRVTTHGSTLSRVSLFERREREFTIGDGTRIQGWLLLDAARRGPRPLLLDIHGGPHNAWNAAADPVHLYHQVLAARGWAVLVLNPRASDGYGEAFYTATIGAWGAADVRDFLEPIDQLVADGVADPDRLAVTGYSYGGFMTCYLTAHDGRFAAAITGGPIVDLVSDCGTSDDGHFMAEAEIAVPWWSCPAAYQALSPITGVRNVRTPTLILQGDDDARCPRGQAQQWFTGLRERRVPSRMVLYPGASHLFPYSGRPSYRLDFNKRIVDWLETYVGAPPS